MTDFSDISSNQVGKLVDTSVTNKINYSFNFERFNEHLVEVHLTFTANTDAPQLWLPAWIPGSYLIREFARNITAVHYQTHASTQTEENQHASLSSKSTSHLKLKSRAIKIDKHTWQLLDIKADQSVSVEYEVYCYDLSVRSAYVDQQRLYGNFTSIALAVEGQEQTPIQVNLLVPASFLANNDAGEIALACGLAASHLQVNNQTDANQAIKHGYGLQANSYEQLIDHPFEIAIQLSFDFIIHDKQHKTLAHSFYLSGKHSANMGRLQQDITQICQSYVNWLGDAPFNDYTFMTYASGQDYGGLEHINSTSLITPRSDLPTHEEPKLPSSDYQRFLGLCSHEYFHSWWVKTVRPDVMLNVDLRQEAYTPLLWVFEGFTSYVDDFMLQVSGVIDEASYLKLLAEQINRYYQTTGRGNQSVAESSFDAWIKLYRSDENTGNAGISYYNKGALVALCLDLTLMQKSTGRYRIFDVIKAFYQQAKDQDNQRIGISSADMGAVISQFMPKADWDDFEQRYVNGVEELPIEQLLSANGITIKIDEKETALPWGLTVQEVSEGLKINKVLRESIASDAGLSAKDIIVAIDGIKANKKQLQHAVKSEMKTISCHAFRRDELLTLEINNKDNSDTHSKLKKIALSLKQTDFEPWLKPNFIE